MHRLQPLECFEVQALVTHDQVTAFHQRQAQVAREVSVLKIGFVVRARREQGNVGIRPRRAHALDAIHQRTVSARQALHVHAFKRLGEKA